MNVTKNIQKVKAKPKRSANATGKLLICALGRAFPYHCSLCLHYVILETNPTTIAKTNEASSISTTVGPKNDQGISVKPKRSVSNEGKVLLLRCLRSFDDSFLFNRFI